MLSLIRNLKLFLVFTLLIIITTAQAGLGTWTSQGPDGGQVLDITIDPMVANIVYATSRGGIYKSTDGGVTWQLMNNGITAIYLVKTIHHPTLSGTLYTIGNHEVFKTTDGGLNWHLSMAGITLATGDRITSIVVTPTNPNVLYLGTLNGVYKSIDAGSHWLPSFSGLNSSINNIIVSPTDANRVLVCAAPNSLSSGGLFESNNAGMTWSDMSSAIPAPYASGISVENVAFAGASGKMYLSAQFGSYIFKSSDNGVSWVHQSGVYGKNIAINPSDIKEVIISGGVGLWKTNLGGINWTHILSDFAGNTTEVSESLVVRYDTFNSAKKYAGTTSNGVYIQTNPNMQWIPSISNMNSETIRGLAVANYPSGTSRVFAAIGDVFSPAHVSFFSDDKGLTWTQNNTGLEASSIREIEVDPFTTTNIASTHVYAVGISGRFDIDFMGNTTDGDGGIYKSTDGGATWSTIDNGIPLNVGPPVISLFGTVRDISLDLNSSVGGGPVQTLYVAGSGRFSDDGMGTVTKLAARIYKSTDAGATWVASDNGISSPTTTAYPFTAAVKIEIDPTDSMTLYASTFLAGYGGTGPVPTLENGVWKSTNAGANWTLASNGLPTIGGPGTSNFSVLSLTIDPTNPNRLYASVHDPITLESQIYKTEDAAASWTLANTGIATSDVRDIFVASNGDVYAAAAGSSGNPGGVYRSQDNGVTWQSMSIGFDNLTAALQLTIDETGTNPLLYAGTLQSVQSFEIVPDVDTDGVADATEAAAPNAGDANADGMPDKDQNNVSSLISNPIDVGVKSAQLNKGISNYVTIEVTPVTGTCDVLEDVQSLTDSSIPDDAHHSFDYGILRFDIVDCTQAKVDIIYHGATDFTDPNWGMRIFAPAVSGDTQFEWQDFNATVTGNKWSLNLTDGQYGDIRPNNGRILFQGGAGNFKNNLFSNGFE